MSVTVLRLVGCGSLAEYTLLFSAALIKDWKTSRNPGAKRGLILSVSICHAVREAVLEWKSGQFSGMLH
jgi:hypothetical protein